jgi:hypothetical protein
LAKAKKKRVSKEIDKLWRTARYWEWLRLVEQEAWLRPVAQWQEPTPFMPTHLRLPAIWKNSAAPVELKHP